MKFCLALAVSLVCLVVTGFGFKLDCSSVDYEEWEIVGKMYRCNVQKLEITERGQVMTGSSLLNLDEINALRMNSLKIFYVPEVITIAKNIEALSIASSQLKLVEKKDLKPYPNLRGIWFSYNELDNLDSDLFDFTSKLEIIDFEGNNFKTIGPNLLNSLKNLNFAVFSKAGCIDVEAYGATEMKALAEIEFKKCPKMRDVPGPPGPPGDEFCQECKDADGIKFRDKILQLENELKQLKDDSKFNDESYDIISNEFDEIQNEVSGEKPNQNKNSFNIIVNQQNISGTFDAVGWKITERKTEIESLTDNFGNDVHPTSLIVRRQHVFYLPSNFGGAFKFLEDLEITGTNLRDINGQSFDDFEKLVNLNLSKNQLRAVPNKVFAFLKTLRFLDLSYNKIERIESESFSGLVEIEYVNLNGNKLTSISVQPFEQMKKLLTLLMRDNKLKQISPNFLSSKRSLRVFDLKNNECISMSLPENERTAIDAVINEKCLAPLEFTYTITIGYNQEKIINFEGMTVKQPNTSIFTITNWDKEQFKDANVLNIENQRVEYFPINLADYLPNLGNFSVLQSQLAALQKDDFKGFGNLVWIRISGNNLMVIEAETFDPLTKLTYLDVSKNNIKSLPPKVFFHLISLHTLILSHNHLQSLTMELFSRNNAITTLLADYNELDTIDVTIFQYFKFLQTINLNINVCFNFDYRVTDLKNIKQKVAENCTESVVFNCEFRNGENHVCHAVNVNIVAPKIKILKIGGLTEFIRAENITVLSVQNQNMNFLPFKLGTSLRNLEKVIIEGSKLTSLQSSDFEGLTQLKSIEIHNNNVESIEDNTFDSVPNLKYLDMSNNNIQKLPSNAFSRLHFVTHLNFSNNYIQLLEASMFSPKNAFEVVKFDHNKLDSLNMKILKILKNADLYDLSANACFDIKYKKSNGAMMEIKGEINTNC